MKDNKAKTLLINLATAGVLVGVVVTGYFVFFKKDAVTPSNINATVETAAQAIAVGVEIDRTIRELSDLKKAIADSVAIFDMQAFRNLMNLSVSIPSQNVGRTNPFVPTDWKIKLEALQKTHGSK